MDTLVEIVATLVVAMAAAALSLFGVKIDAPQSTAHKPPMISRTSEAAALPVAPAAALVTAPPPAPTAVHCPIKKTRPAADKA